MSTCFSELLQQSSARHSHLCPRQVLGVRMGLAGLRTLGLEFPVSKRSALVIVETDGCFADGIEVATGATIGHRTLRVNDFGKIAATFADVRTRRAIRISPTPEARVLAPHYAPHEERRYFAQLEGYKVMPDEELFRSQEVALNPPLEALISVAGLRVTCDFCGEEVINERQVLVDGATLCQTCAHHGYYYLTPSPVDVCLPVESPSN